MEGSSIIVIIEKKQLALVGHLQRVNNQRWLKIFLKWTPEEKEYAKKILDHRCHQALASRGLQMDGRNDQKKLRKGSEIRLGLYNLPL